jgi:hypothetical protein
MFHITFPPSPAIFQRDPSNQANIRISGTILKVFEKLPIIIRARYISANSPNKSGIWIESTITKRLSSFSLTVQLPASPEWYEIEVQLVRKNSTAVHVLAKKCIHRIGVGEIFLTAGQSNSANSGTDLTGPVHEQILALGPKGWQFALDPQPIAGGTGGSPWPATGDSLYEKVHVPIGFISVGVGGTEVKQWLPGHQHYPRLITAFQRLSPYGIRAILWHQGESDTTNKTSATVYAERFRMIVNTLQKDTQKVVPWLVAQAAFVPDVPPEQINAVLAGQKSLVDHKTIFSGPNTEELTGSPWRAPDHLHFSGKGLIEHGKRWAAAIIAALSLQ